MREMQVVITYTLVAQEQLAKFPFLFFLLLVALKRSNQITRLDASDPPGSQNRDTGHTYYGYQARDLTLRLGFSQAYLWTDIYLLAEERGLTVGARPSHKHHMLVAAERPIELAHVLRKYPVSRNTVRYERGIH